MNEIERPDPKVLFVWRAEVLTTWGIILVITLAGLIGFVYTVGMPWWYVGFAAIPLLFGVLSLSLLKLRWKFWTFQITPDSLEMSHGWWIRKRRIVALSRIQHIDFDSGPIGRKFDLVHVVVHTAGANVGTIPGIRTERAERLRSELMSGRKAL